MRRVVRRARAGKEMRNEGKIMRNEVNEAMRNEGCFGFRDN